jgi:hypothetical protein
MEYHFWTKQELSLLEEWDWVLSYIDAHLPKPVSVEELQRKFQLEAKLLIANKLIVLYDRNSALPSEILSFKEYLTIKENSGAMKFHPINFKNYRKYRRFISYKRDKVLSMIK